MSVAIPTVTLNNGVPMPILGFGVYQVPAEQTEQVVLHALDAGYRLLDTAAAYGNEEAVGRAIAKSGIARDELFVTTKLWVQDTGEEATRRACDRSLQRLGLDHLDLYQIDQPYGDVHGSWRAMQQLNPERMAQNLAVSGFELTDEQMARIATLDTGASLSSTTATRARRARRGGRRRPSRRRVVAAPHRAARPVTGTAAARRGVARRSRATNGRKRAVSEVRR
jgi:diketogulonate reductase-like aldo/keto reductase